FFFFFTVSSPSEFYTLSLHDALPISTTYIYSASLYLRLDLLTCEESVERRGYPFMRHWEGVRFCRTQQFMCQLQKTRDDSCVGRDRKSTRLNSSHVAISYAVFCLKKK